MKLIEFHNSAGCLGKEGRHYAKNLHPSFLSGIRIEKNYERNAQGECVLILPSGRGNTDVEEKKHNLFVEIS